MVFCGALADSLMGFCVPEDSALLLLLLTVAFLLDSTVKLLFFFLAM